MAINMKVYGGITYVDGNQVRTIIATSTKKKAVELLGEPSYVI